MAKPVGTGKGASVRSMQKLNGDRNIFFHFFKIFVNFDVFAIHISRNCYKHCEKWNIYF